MIKKGQFSINGNVFTPKSLAINFESLATADSGRTDSGKMMIDWVYTNLRKLEIEMPPCSSEDIAQLFRLVQGKQYNLTYFDPITNGERTGYFYTSNTHTDMYSGILYNGLYQGVKFNAIEVAGEK